MGALEVSWMESLEQKLKGAFAEMVGAGSGLGVMVTDWRLEVQVVTEL